MSGSLSVAPGLSELATPGNLLGAPPCNPSDNQKFWGWDPAVCSLLSPPGDSGTCSSLRTDGVNCLSGV